SSSEWKYKTGMYWARRVERCAGVKLLPAGDAAPAVGANATAAHPSRMLRPHTRHLSIDVSLAGVPTRRARLSLRVYVTRRDTESNAGSTSAASPAAGVWRGRATWRPQRG